jgi:hypothetical protein
MFKKSPDYFLRKQLDIFVCRILSTSYGSQRQFSGFFRLQGTSSKLCDISVLFPLLYCAHRKQKQQSLPDRSDSQGRQSFFKQDR